MKQKETTNQFKPKQSPSAVVDAHRAATFSWLKLLPKQKPFEQILKASCISSALGSLPGDILVKRCCTCIVYGLTPLLNFSARWRENVLGSSNGVT